MYLTRIQGHVENESANLQTTIQFVFDLSAACFPAKLLNNNNQKLKLTTHEDLDAVPSPTDTRESRTVGLRSTQARLCSWRNVKNTTHTTSGPMQRLVCVRVWAWDHKKCRETVMAPDSITQEEKQEARLYPRAEVHASDPIPANRVQ